MTLSTKICSAIALCVLAICLCVASTAWIIVDGKRDVAAAISDGVVRLAENITIEVKVEKGKGE